VIATLVQLLHQKKLPAENPSAGNFFVKVQPGSVFIGSYLPLSTPFVDHNTQGREMSMDNVLQAE